MNDESKTTTPALMGAIGAHISWANTIDRAARTAPARAALDRKFLEQADGDPVRAAHLRKAHFAQLALKSAKARRKAKEARERAAEAEAAVVAAEAEVRDTAPIIARREFADALRPILALAGAAPEDVLAEGLEVTGSHISFLSVTPIPGVGPISVGVGGEAIQAWPVSIEVSS